MRNRYLVVATALAAFALTACGGDDEGDGDNDRATVLQRSAEANELLLAEETALEDMLPFVAEACREEFAPAFEAVRAIFAVTLADQDVEIRPTDVRFDGDDRAVVSQTVFLDGEEQPAPAEALNESLWVRDGGEWRLAVACEAFRDGG